MIRSVVVAVVVVAACSSKTAAPAPSAAPATEAIEKSTDGGPVKATVALSPAKPRLGDRLTLLLTVDSAPGVNVLMPAFGDALGRFAILEFVPGAPQRLPDGGTRTVQRYTLDAPLSGKQRVPSLRIEVSDERRDAGPGTTEVLTEEIPVEISSVLADEKGAQAELRPVRGRLSEDEARGRAAWLLPLAIGAPLLLIAAFFLIRAARRRAAARARVNAFDVATRRLQELEARGYRPEDADVWYVELSAIVRRYIEDRFAIRAPELTSEEFLHVARRSPELGDAHATLLTQFLAGCDRVKFAAYKPEAKESTEALGAAHRFLDETRLVEAEPAPRRKAA